MFNSRDAWVTLYSGNRTLTLDPESLKAVTDRVYNGFTVSQIGILMAVAPSSVSQQKSRIKKRLLQSAGCTLGEGESLDEWLGRF